MREATYVLNGLIYQDALPICETYSDTAGYADLIFGLFDVLGYRFATRLRDRGSTERARRPCTACWTRFCANRCAPSSSSSTGTTQVA